LSGKLNPKLTYNVNGTLFWAQLDGSNLGFTDKRTGTTAQGRASMSWQASAKDLVQINGFLVGKRLTPQGYAKPFAGIDFGYRRKISDQVSLLVAVQDPLGLFRDKQVIDTPALKSLAVRDPDARNIRVTLAWTFGTGKNRKDPGFEFTSPGGGPQ
jgi:hypothetical protein